MNTEEWSCLAAFETPPTRVSLIQKTVVHVLSCVASVHFAYRLYEFWTCGGSERNPDEAAFSWKTILFVLLIHGSLHAGLIHHTLDAYLDNKRRRFPLSKTRWQSLIHDVRSHVVLLCIWIGYSLRPYLDSNILIPTQTHHTYVLNVIANNCAKFLTVDSIIFRGLVVSFSIFFEDLVNFFYRCQNLVDLLDPRMIIQNIHPVAINFLLESANGMFYMHALTTTNVYGTLLSLVPTHLTMFIFLPTTRLLEHHHRKRYVVDVHPRSALRSAWAILYVCVFFVIGITCIYIDDAISATMTKIAVVFVVTISHLFFRVNRYALWAIMFSWLSMKKKIIQW